MKLVLLVVLSLSLLSAVVGSAAAVVAAAPHQADSQLFTWVPEGGFPNRFPFGQCTWWAAYNHPVSWNGNAGDWLENAREQGVPTSGAPSVGAIAVYRPGGDYHREYGHVAIVVAVGSGSYTVSEMNAVGWGRVSTRVVPWPDEHVQGFIPLSPHERR